MVSGLVTSPCDQLRIFSGEARLMRIASKSAIGFARSKGLERNKVFLHFLLSRQQPVASGQLPVLMFRQGRERTPRRTLRAPRLPSLRSAVRRTGPFRPTAAE